MYWKGKSGKQPTAKIKPPTKTTDKGKPPGMTSGSAPPGGLGKSGDKSRPAPICFRCGKKGHLSRNFTHVTAQRLRTATGSADVIFDMTPWAAEFAEWRARQDQPAPAEEPFEDVYILEETKGCAILDSGATVMCSSTVAAEEIQMQRLRQNEPGGTKCWRFRSLLPICRWTKR